MLSRLFKYELKKLILNKFFLGLLIISAIYSNQVMGEDIILGVANTAPFSGWSYGMYLSNILPILLVTLLFFISFLYSKQEKKIQVLIKATSFDIFKFQMLRFGTIITAFILISMVPIGYSFWVYKVIFHFSSFGDFILPTVITLLPAMLFIFGLGIVCGKFSQGIIFILMVAVIIISYIPLPYAIDLFGSNFFKNYSGVLNIVEPNFSIPTSVIIGKFIYCILGIVMMLSASIPRNKNNNKGIA